uniref:Uncharacterized protein n=1 Tax=Sipha flava TaxID=143950 RepID=A0A2S2QVY3_9HEMI
MQLVTFFSSVAIVSTDGKSVRNTRYPAGSRDTRAETDGSSYGVDGVQKGGGRETICVRGRSVLRRERCWPELTRRQRRSRDVNAQHVMIAHAKTGATSAQQHKPGRHRLRLTARPRRSVARAR